MYTDDNDQTFPSAVKVNDSGDNWIWTAWQGRWYSKLIEGEYVGSGSENLDEFNWAVFECPEVPNPGNQGDDTYGHPGWRNQFISYGLNGPHIGHSLRYDVSRQYDPASRGDVVQGARTILMLDTRTTNGIPGNGAGHFFASDSTSWSNVGKGDARHSGSANVAFVDGHVESFSSPTPNDPDGLYEQHLGFSWEEDALWIRNRANFSSP
jgi:prepilin-type processing-associated H-X9-DG protein